MADNLYKTTPVLTVFARDNETTAQLTCHKLVTEPRPEVVEENRAAFLVYNLLDVGYDCARRGAIYNGLSIGRSTWRDGVYTYG